MVFEAASVSKAVPYGDSFAVVNRFELLKDSKKAGYMFKVITQIQFSKSIWGLKGIITSAATEGAKEFYFKLRSLLRERTSAQALAEITGPKKVHRKTKSTSKKEVIEVIRENPPPSAVDITEKKTDVERVEIIQKVTKISWNDLLAQKFADNPIVVGVIVVFLLLTLYWVISLFCRVTDLELELSRTLERTSKLERDLLNMQQFVEQIPQKLDGDMKQGVLEKVLQWKDQLTQLEQTLKHPKV